MGLQDRPRLQYLYNFFVNLKKLKYNHTTFTLFCPVSNPPPPRFPPSKICTGSKAIGHELCSVWGLWYGRVGGWNLVETSSVRGEGTVKVEREHSFGA